MLALLGATVDTFTESSRARALYLELEGERLDSGVLFSDTSMYRRSLTFDGCNYGRNTRYMQFVRPTVNQDGHVCEDVRGCST